MITLERVEELRVAVDLSHHSDIALLNDERLDLLSILTEYADKLRAGEDSKVSALKPLAEAPSPGSISREDE